MASLYWLMFVLHILHILLETTAVCKTSRRYTCDNNGCYPRLQAICADININEIENIYTNGNSAEILNVTSSDTTVMNPGIFRKFDQLREVHIRFSNISEICKGVFTGCDRLQLIDISANSIYTIEPKSFYGLNTLKLLNISQNNLSNTKFLFGETDNNVTTLDLSYNNISDIIGISDCQNLTYLNLSVNTIVKLKDNDFKALTHLVDLNLNGNLIDELQDHCFSGLSNLENLHLEDNYVTHIPIGIFREMRSLAFLNFSNNKIGDVSIGTFAGLTCLRTIDLSFNKITTLSTDVLHDLRSIRALLINDNGITDINARYFVDHLPFLANVSLEGNDWTCTKLSEIIRNLNSKHIYLKLGTTFKGKTISGIACSGDLDVTEIKSNNSGSINDVKSYLETGFKKSQFYKFFNTDSNKLLDRFVQSLQDAHLFDRVDKDFVNSKFYRYFTDDFKQSGFYKFFNGDSNQLLDRFEQSLKNANIFDDIDRDFVNSKFYRYFSDDYINASFFEYLDKKMDDIKTVHVNKSELITEYFNFLKPNSDYLKDVSPEEKTSNALLKTQNNLVLAVVFILLLVWVTLILWLCRSLKIDKFDGLQFSRCWRKDVQNTDDELL